MIEIAPMDFTVVDGKLFLNYNDIVQGQRLSVISGYIRKADTNWPDAMKRTKCTRDGVRPIRTLKAAH